MELFKTTAEIRGGFALLDPHTVVPAVFTTVARSESHEVELNVLVGSNGRAHCSGVTVRPLDLGLESQPVTREVLSRIPLRRLVREAVLGASMKITEKLPDGARVLDPLSASERDALGDRLRRPRRGKPITDAQLRTVAERYRAAVARGKPPTEQLASEFNVGRSTAARWVTKARERGFLGPALKGQAGEARKGKR